MKMNRRGESDGNLTDNTIGIIVAVLGIALLGVAVFQLYGVLSNQEEKSAQRTIDLIESKINALEEGQEAKVLIQGFDGSEDWSVVGWSFDEPLDEKPEKCSLESCICICNKVAGITSTFKNECQEKGFCRFFDRKEIFVGKMYGEGAVKDPLRLEKGFLEIEISKKEGISVFITAEEFVDTNDVVGGF
jgi:hypothetical protein